MTAVREAHRGAAEPDASARRARRRAGGPIRGLLAVAWLPAALVALWFVVSLPSSSIYFPPLTSIVGRLVGLLGTATFWGDIGSSVRNLVTGLAIGSVLGTAVGIGIGLSRTARAALDPFLQFARFIPQVAIVPIIIGVLGIDAAPKVYVIATACVWPVLLNAVDGVRRIDPGLREMTVAYRISPARLLFRVVLPAALPQVVAGIRVALSIGVVIMVVSEAFGATQGIGYFITYSGATFDVPGTWAGTIVVALLGYALNVLFLLGERRLLRWYYLSAE